MKSSKLYYYLSNLDDEDKRGFRDFLRSPIFNKAERFVLFYDHFDKYVIQAREDDVSAEEFFKRAKPDKDFNLNQLGKTMSGLLKLVFDYFSFVESSRDSFTREKFLLRGLGRRDLDKYFPGEFEKAMEQISESGTISMLYFHQRYELEQELAGYHSRQNIRGIPNLGKINELFESYVLLRKLESANFALNEKKVITESFEPEGMAEVIKRVEERFDEMPDLVKIYYLVYKSISEPTVEKHYFDLKDLLEKTSPVVEPLFRRKMYVYCVNYCMRKFNGNSQRFKDEIKALYNFLLEKEIILEKGKIMAENFRNIVVLMCHSKSYEWVEKFIKEFGPRISGDYNDNALNYAKATLAFSRGNFREAKHLLLNALASYRYVLFAFDSRGFLCKVLYELGETEELLNEMEKFRLFILRDKKISPARKDYGGYFIRKVKKILSILELHKEDRAPKLRELQSTLIADQDKFMYNTAWLHDKIREALERS